MMDDYESKIKPAKAMIDYKIVVESLIDKARSLNVQIEYIVTQTNVKIIFPKGFTYTFSSTPELNNESYKHLLELMFMQLVVNESKRIDQIPIKIIAVVFHEKGSCPFEIEYDSTKSVQEWYDYFREETKKIAQYPIVFYIKKVYADKEETIYLNKDVIKNLANL